MIDEETVFILGAGASKPYGYPIGPVLVKNIVDSIDQAKLSFFEYFDITSTHLKDFKEAITSSLASSIDFFLSDRKDFIKVGKLCIATILLQCENPNINGFAYRKEGIYHFIFEQMKKYCDIKEFGENKVSFITFNYDRSLEFVFHNALNTYAQNKQEIHEQLSKIPIIHLHGYLGSLPWQTGKQSEVFEYGSLPKKKDQIINDSKYIRRIESSAEKLTLLTNAPLSSEEFIRSKNAINNAKKIYFIGFGFDERSMKNLGLNNPEKKDVDLPLNYGLISKSTCPAYRGSSLGLRQIDIEKIQHRYGIFLPDKKLHGLEFLQDYYK